MTDERLADPPVCIWIRRTLDWEDEDAAFAAIAPPRMVPVVRLWNATFTMTYQRFRSRLVQIAAVTNAAVTGAATLPWDEIPDGALVLPVDDDDWFAPDAARTVAASAEPGVSALLWPARAVQVPVNRGHGWHLLKRRLLPSTPPTFLCATNNYALVKGADVPRGVFLQHREASLWAADRLRDGRAREVDGALSLMNRTLASQTSLALSSQTLDRAGLLRKRRRYERLYRRPLPPDLAWARPAVARMAELMAELEVR